MSFRDWLRGLRLLRHPELVRELAERGQRLAQLQELRTHSPGAKLGSEVRLLGSDMRRLSIDPGATVCDGTILSLGDELNGLGEIHIGENTWIGQYNNLRAAGGSIVIGKNCLVSQFCTLVASNHGMDRDKTIRSQAPSEHRRGVVVGDDVWLGSGVAIMPGVKIGDGAVVGANAVVTHDIPPYEIWGGVPARRIAARE